MEIMMSTILVTEMSEKHTITSDPSTPPPLYAAQFSTPPNSYFPSNSASSSTSRLCRSNSAGLVSRPTSPDLDEKHEKQRSIEVPGIVLTAPPCPQSPLRPASPPPKSIILLPPTQVTVSLSSKPSSPVYTRGGSNEPYLYSPSFAELIRSRSTAAPLSSSVGIRIIMLLMLCIVGGWHLWSHLEASGMVADVIDVVAAESI